MLAALKNALAFCAVVMAGQALAQATFHEDENFQGQSFSTQRQIGNLERFGFNDRASSGVVAGNLWEVCDDVRFRGRCVILRPGRYSSLAAMGLNNRVYSVRAVDRNARIDGHAGCAALREPAQPGATAILGCHLHISRPGTPGADDGLARVHNHGECAG